MPNFPRLAIGIILSVFNGFAMKILDFPCDLHEAPVGMIAICKTRQKSSGRARAAASFSTPVDAARPIA
jgi:hypothetical protein